MPSPPPGHFDPTITIETRRPGRFKVVTSVPEAAETLLDEWPPNHRESTPYSVATRACLLALEHPSAKATAQARGAFRAAARDADIFIREGR